MPEVSEGDLALLRTHPHRSKLYMIIQDPQIVLAARVNNDSAIPGNRLIVFDNAAYVGGIWTDYTDLESGMTVWIGSAAGGRDKGEVRLISATETVLTVSENWDIEWADNLYISVLKQWRLWAKQPRQVPDAEAGTVDWYMDYDDSYTDENEEYRPVPIMGPHRVVFKENGDATIAFVWSDSYAVKAGAAVDTWLLAAEGGSDYVAASETPTVTYTAASGKKGFLVKLTVTDDNASPQSEIGYRFAFVMSRTGANAPFSSFDMRSVNGSFNVGGWTASFIVRETDVSEADFPDGALVIIFAEDWYGATHAISVADEEAETFTIVGDVAAHFTDGAVFTVSRSTGNDGDYTTVGDSTFGGGVTTITVADVPDGTDDGDIAKKVSIGGNTANAENIVFVGYIVADTVIYDAFTQQVTFEARGIAGEMQNTEADPMVLEDNDSPSDWFEMVDVTADHVALFVARYLSNLIQIADFTISGDTRETVFWEVPGGSLYEQINTNVYNDALFCRLLADRMSRLWAEIDIQMISQTDRDGLATIMEITKPDRRDVVRLSHPMEPAVARVETSGVYYPGGGAEVYAYISDAPGPARRRRGADLVSSNLALSSQAQCNNLAGWLLAKVNCDYPEIQIRIAGNYRVFDIVPQEYVILSLLAADNNRNLVWTTEKLIPRSIVFAWRAADSMFLTNITCERDAIGLAGQVVELPPDVEDWDFPDWKPWPPPPPPFPAPGTWKTTVYVATKTLGVFRTVDFSGPSGGDPTWVTDNVGLDSLEIVYACQDPWDPVHYRYVIADNDLYRMYTGTPGAAGVHTKVLSAEQAGGLMGGGAPIYIFSVEGNINKSGYIYVLAGYGVLYSSGELYCLISPDRGNTWSAHKVRSGRGAATVSGNVGSRLVCGARRGSSSYVAGEVLYVAVNKGVGASWLLYYSVDGGVTWSTEIAEGGSLLQSFCWVDHSDQEICYFLVFAGGTYQLWRTLDHGQTAALLRSWLTGTYWDTLYIHVWDHNWLYLTDEEALYESMNFGVSWKKVGPTYALKNIYTLCICHDAPKLLYVGRHGDGDSNDYHTIWASKNETRTLYGKAGANCDVIDTGDGDSIPYNAGGIPRTGIMPVPV